VLSLHALIFALWYVMINPAFIPCDDAIQGVLSFIVIKLQVNGEDVLRGRSCSYVVFFLFLFLACCTSDEKYGCVTTALLVIVGLKHS
jgi:hypothetical protein